MPRLTNNDLELVRKTAARVARQRLPTALRDCADDVAQTVTLKVYAREGPIVTSLRAYTETVTRRCVTELVGRASREAVILEKAGQEVAPEPEHPALHPDEQQSAQARALVQQILAAPYFGPDLPEVESVADRLNELADELKTRLTGSIDLETDREIALCVSALANLVYFGGKGRDEKNLKAFGRAAREYFKDRPDMAPFVSSLEGIADRLYQAVLAGIQDGISWNVVADKLARRVATDYSGKLPALRQPPETLARLAVPALDRARSNRRARDRQAAVAKAAVRGVLKAWGVPTSSADGVLKRTQ